MLEIFEGNLEDTYKGWYCLSDWKADYGYLLYKYRVFHIENGNYKGKNLKKFAQLKPVKEKTVFKDKNYEGNYFSFNFRGFIGWFSTWNV